MEVETLTGIVCPGRSSHVQKLRNKLDEYHQRYAGRPAKDVPKGHKYKIRLLTALLEHGSVDLLTERRAAAAEPGFDGRKFDEATTIITAYSENDLSGICGGTGLQ